MADFLQGIFAVLFGSQATSFTGIAIYTVVVAVYAIFVWTLHNFLGRQDVFIFEGMKKDEVPWKVSDAMYLFVYPMVVFLIFFFFSMLLIMISKEQTVETILVFSATLVAAIRITAYYNEDLSKAMANLIPLTVLAVFLVDPSHYSFSSAFQKFLTIPSKMDLIMMYLLFIVLLEWLLRGLVHIRDTVFPEPPRPLKP